jgi:hypothetical protein
MKKYFKNTENLTIQDLINIVNANTELGFYLPIELNKERITIHNWNNGNKGRGSLTFILQEDQTYKA